MIEKATNSEDFQKCKKFKLYKPKKNTYTVKPGLSKSVLENVKT